MTLRRSLRAKLLAAGHQRMEIGNAMLHLDTGKLTRTIALDGKVVAEPEFTKVYEIEWDIVEKALS
jgi:uncharacterized protein Smg (DUF494 family)